MGNVTPFRRKPTELVQNTNPYLQSAKVVAQFRLPDGVSIQNLANIAQTVPLADLGIVIPKCKYPDRFEAGLRYGLAHNRRTDIKTYFRVLFSTGFCWAKIFYRKFAPSHPLAASGSYKGKVGVGGEIIKTKDV